MRHFEQAAILLKLKHKVTANPPLYFSRTPKVNGSFLKAYYHQDSETLWIYRDAAIEERIDESIKGKMNEGCVLGYPECCMKWHMEYRTREIESVFQDVENFMVRNPLVLGYCQIGTEEDIYQQVLGMNYPKEENEQVWAVINHQLLETYRHYPYVPHWACNACLTGESKETEKCNAKYEELMESVDPKFKLEYFDSIKRAVRELE